MPITVIYILFGVHKMTFIPRPPSYDYNLSFFTDPTSVSLSNSYTVLPQTHVTVVGTPAATLDTSNGIITLPDVPCLLSGCLQYFLNTDSNFVDFQWYDVTNSQYIGNKARLKGKDPDRYMNTYTLSADEEANVIAQNIQVKMIVTETSSTSAVLEYTTGTLPVYAGRTRIAVYEF